MNQNFSITITTGTIVKIVIVLVAAYLVYFFRDLVLVVITAIVVASAIEPAIKLFERYKIPRMYGSIASFGILTGFLALVTALVVPTIVSELNQLASNIPEYREALRLWLESQSASSPIIDNVVNQAGGFSYEELAAGFGEAVGLAANSLGNIVGSLFGSILNFFLIIVLAFYFSTQEYGIDNFLKIVVPPKHSKYAINLWRRSQRKIGLWMQGQLIIMLLTGVVTYLFLLIAGVPYAFVLAMLAGFSELIPVVGIFISSIPALAVAYIAGGTSLLIATIIFYVVWQQIQGNAISPAVVNKVVGVPPLLVILGLIVGTQLFGILGAILSVPFAAALMEYIKDVEKNHNQEIMRQKIADDQLAERIAEKVAEKTEAKKTEAEEDNIEIKRTK